MTELLPGFRAQLESRAGELDRATDAADATAAHAPRVDDPVHPAAPGRSQSRRRLRGPHGQGLAALVLVAGASVGGLAYAAATSLWQPQLSPAGEPGAMAVGSPVPPDQLRALGALRRAQTDLDRNVGSRYALQLTAGEKELVRTNAVRRLATGRGGGVVVLVPFELKRSAEWSRGPGSKPRTTFKRDQLCLNYVGPFDGGGVYCGSIDDLLAGKIGLGLSDGECTVRAQRQELRKAQAREDRWARLEGREPVQIPCARSRKRNVTHWVGLVPDGVAKVQLGRRPGALTVPVHDNLWQSDRGSGFTRDHVWLDAAGHEVPRKRAVLRARLGLPPTP